ncbi:MAG TPA: alcohol dehydrogenase catalytic domain-containing protein [Beijerinckiaceae bacterium]
MTGTNMMKAARLHAFGQPLRIDDIPTPDLRPDDVLVEVRGCGVVDNLNRVLANFFGAQRVMPDMPAIFGLDAVGVVAEVGSRVRAIRPGTRVYVNPGRGCGSCRPCRAGATNECPDFTYTGYFGRSIQIMRDYPYGGLAQYLTAPPSALVTLPDAVSFEGAARFGYLGTAYAALKKIEAGPGDSLLVNGVTGTLGVNAAMIALAMGVTKILGTGRNLALLERVKRLDPKRVEVFAFGAGGDDREEQESFRAWVRSHTDGYGADHLIDCMPPGAPASAISRALSALRRGGRATLVGAVMEELSVEAFWLMTNAMRLEGSAWFTTRDGQEMAEMAAAGTLDLDVMDHRVYPLAQVNEGLAAIERRQGGFDNFVIDPSAR